MITLRQATLEERPAIADLTLDAYAEYADEMGEESWLRYAQSTRELILTDPSLLRMVAVEDDDIVGSVVYCPPYEKDFGAQRIKNPYPEMRLLSIVPRHRNKGIADKLINACEQKAAQENSAAITLHTTRLMAVAKAMYERRGYQRFSEIDFHLAPDVVVLGYVKKLDNGVNHDSN
jgi:GNAT superfamily N-acetyltransferase